MFRDPWRSNGWEAVCNDKFTDMVTFIPPIVAGLIVGGLYTLGAVYLTQWEAHAVKLGAVAGLLIGFLLCNMVMRLIAAVQNVIIQSYIEKRKIFKFKHDTLVQSLEEKLHTRYPGFVLNQI